MNWWPGRRRVVQRITVVLLVLGICESPMHAQSLPAAAASSRPTAPDKPPLKNEELEQLLASIALYPDALLTQVLMASTYPLEIVQADRWVKAHPDLKGDPLAKELEKQTWDASIKSLVNFPQVLAMMSEKLDLTIKIGDAFIGQQVDVMNTVQKLRSKARSTGNLATNQQQKVIVEPATPSTQPTTVVVQQAAPTEIIRIESAQPQVIYVPTYSPTVVYGTWPYPYYPPAPYYPPNYVASNMISFGVGVACGVAWGYAWGNSNWNGGDVDIDVNRNTNINTNIDRSKAQANIDARRQNAQGGAGNRGTWQHDASHRQGVAYRDQKTASQFGASNARTAQAREQYRGRADTGRQDLSRGAADQFKGNNGATANRGTANRATPNTANRTNTANRPAPSGSRGGAFDGVNSSGSSARAQSQRGQASRSSGGGARSAPRGGGGGRGGGGRR